MKSTSGRFGRRVRMRWLSGKLFAAAGTGTLIKRLAILVAVLPGFGLVTGCSSVTDRRNAVIQEITGTVVADSGDSVDAQQDDPVRGVIAVGQTQPFSFRSEDAESESSSDHPPCDFCGAVAPVSVLNEAAKDTSDIAVSVFQPALVPPTPTQHEVLLSPLNANRGGTLSLSAVGSPGVRFISEGCGTECHRLSGTNADLIDSLTKRVERLEDDLEESRRTVAGLSNALISGDQDRKRLERHIGHWEAEVERLEKTIWRQQESDIASLTAISDTLQSLARRQQQSEQGMNDVPKP